MRDGFLKVACATPHIRVGDCTHNAAQIVTQMRQAAAEGAKVVCFPELAVTGYTCADLFLQNTLIRGAESALRSILEQTAGLDLLAVVGLPVRHNSKLYNCAAVLCRGELLGLVPKTNLPNYTEFNENRWFASGREVNYDVISFAGEEQVEFSSQLIFRCDEMEDLVIGVEICEDIWVADTPSTRLCAGGATLILNPSASTEEYGKAARRRALLCAASARLACGYLYASAGRGESTTDVVYSGHDLIVENGSVLNERIYNHGMIVSELDLERMRHLRQRLTTYPATGEVYAVHFSLDSAETRLTRTVEPNPFIPEDEAERAQMCHEILALAAQGLAQRLEHTRAKHAVLGLSGGLDSTLALITTVRAFDLLGLDRENIIAVTMPCFGTTDRTRDNACILAEEMGVTLKRIDIGNAVQVHFADIGQSMDVHDVTFENGQARERTQVLMDVANQYGAMVIGTGDLSELALGWCTYNGDHMSMYSVNGSVPKTQVRLLVDYFSRQVKSFAPKTHTVLQDILATPVSPELLPAVDGDIAQRTEDLVGPYELHDFFLYYALGWGFTPKKIYRLARYALGGQYDSAVILKWLRSFYRRFFSQQFKRSCLPDGPKVGPISLSPRGDWRMPSDAVATLWLQELEELD